MKKSQNYGGFIQIILVLILIALVGGGMYYFGTLKNKTSLDHDTDWWGKQSPFPLASVQPTKDPTSSWKSYTNTKYGFSFKYPQKWRTDLHTIPDIDKEYRLITDKNEFVNLIVVDGNGDTSNDKSWLKNINLMNGKFLIISYTDNIGPGSKGGIVDIEDFDQILSTFKFTE